MDNHYFNKTYVIRNNTCYAVFKKLCHGDLLANISANATNATACIETEIYMKVDDRKCQGKLQHSLSAPTNFAAENVYHWQA